MYVAVTAVFPLAPLFSIVHNLAEQRSHAFKLCFLYRRAVPKPGDLSQLSADWLPVMKAIAVGSAGINAWGLLSALRGA